MKQKRAFPFETQAKNDETGKVRIEFGLSKFGYIRIDSLVPFMPFRDMMIPLFQTLLLKPPSIEKDQIGYRDWYANEILKRIRENTDVFENKPDHMKVDLRQLLERRNALLSRMSAQMDYYEKNKHKIDEMAQIRANHWKVYSGPHICKIENLLIFEGLSEYCDIYWRVAWPTKPLREEDERRETIAAWIEMSYQFINDLEGQTPDGVQTELLLSSSKPRADIRVLRRGEDETKRTFDLRDKWVNSLRYIHIIEYMYHKEYLDFDPVSVKINQVELFDLVFRIYSNTSPNSILDCTFTFIPGEQRELQIRTDENSILITLMYPDIPVAITQVGINSTLFHIIRPLLHHIKEAEFILLPQGYPSYINLYGPATITLAMNEAITTEQQKHQNEFLNSIPVVFEDLPEDELEELTDIINFRSAFFPDKNVIYPFTFNDFTYNLSSKTRDANIYLKTYNKSIKKADQVFLDALFQTRVQLSRGEIIYSECNCGQNYQKFPCQHVIALIIKSYLEGWTHD